MSNSKSKNHKRFDDEMDMEKERVMQKHNKQNSNRTKNDCVSTEGYGIVDQSKPVMPPIHSSASEDGYGKASPTAPIKNNNDAVKTKPSNDFKRLQFDEETGLLILRVSNNTLPTKLAGAIIKHFKDGAKGMVIISIGSNALNIAIKSVAVSQNYLLNETDKKFLNKQVAIVPKFYEFVNENGNVNTVKLIINLI